MLKTTSRIGLTARLGICILLSTFPSYALDYIEVHLRIFGKGVVTISGIPGQCDKDYQEIENIPALADDPHENGAALFQATGTAPNDGNGPYQFVAWYIRPFGPILSSWVNFYASVAFANQDVMEVDCIFARPRVVSTTSPDVIVPNVFQIKATDSAYTNNGPSMPSVEFELASDLAQELTDYIDLVRYEVIIGEPLTINGEDKYRTLYYPDCRPDSTPTGPGIGDTILDQPVHSTQSFTDTVTIPSDWDWVGNVGWGTSLYGVGGGYPRHVTARCTFYLSQLLPSRACCPVSCQTTVSNDEACQDKLFTIVGEQPTTQRIDAYIDALDLVIYPDETTPTDYKLREGDNDAELGGVAPQIIPLISVSNDTDDDTTFVVNGVRNLKADYAEAQLKLMLHTMHVQESTSRQFKYGGSGWSSRSGYPMWQNNATNSDKTGLGLYQLTSSQYKTRETIWNWKKNALMACYFMMRALRTSCEELNVHHPVVASNVFQPGLNLPGIEFDLHVMRRLNAFTRFNGGFGNQYYSWNNTSSSPVVVHSSGAALSGTFPGNPAPELYDIGITNLPLQVVAHGVTGASMATLHAQDQSLLGSAKRTKALDDDDDFEWIIAGLDTSSFMFEASDTTPDKDERHATDHQLWYRLGIWSGSTLEASAQIYDVSITTDDGRFAGFRAPLGRWVKQGYIAVGTENQGWRDYNTDGIADIDGDPYGVGASGDNNDSDTRAERYADECEDRLH